MISGETRQRHTDEVHQVIAGESHRQGKRTQQHHDLEDIHPAPVKQLHQQGESHQAAQDNHRGMRIHPSLVLRCHESQVFHTLNQQEIDDRRGSHATEDTDLPSQFASIIEREKETGQILHQRAEEKGDTHREEDTQDDRQRLLRVQQVEEGQSRGVSRHFPDGQREAGSQQLEHHRDRRRGRHTQRVKHIEQHDVGGHHRHEDADQLIKMKILRPEDAVPRDVHHAVAHRRAHEYTDRRDRDNRAKRGRLGANRRVQEVDRIVTHPD